LRVGKSKGRYTLVTLPRNVTPYYDSVDGDAFFHFICAFGNGRRSYTSEAIAKRTVRSAIDTTWTLCNHVMQSCCIAYSFLGELRQYFADCKYLQ